MYYVYAIGLIKDLKEPWSACYIGVTNNMQKRWAIDSSKGVTCYYSC